MSEIDVKVTVRRKSGGDYRCEVDVDYGNGTATLGGSADAQTRSGAIQETRELIDRMASAADDELFASDQGKAEEE